MYVGIGITPVSSNLAARVFLVPAFYADTNRRQALRLLPLLQRVLLLRTALINELAQAKGIVEVAD